MKITLKWLKEKNACPEGIEYFIENKLENTAHETIVNHLIKQDKLNWASWLITRLLIQENCVRYAIYAAELVLPLFEEKYTKDVRPREAIEAAKKWLISKSKKDAEAVYAASKGAYESYKAAYKASAANEAAYAAYEAAYSAACAANAAYAPNATYAAYSAAYAANAAYSAAKAGDYAAYSAACAANAAYAAQADRKEMYTKILKHGLQLINEQEEVLS